MTKKHFIALADYIREHNRIAQFNTALSKYDEGHIEGLASFCKAQNPDFNRDRWVGYIRGECGKNGGCKVSDIDSNLMMETITDEPESAHRVSRVINRDYVRRWALEYCRDHDMPSKRKKIRCSEGFLNMIEAATKSAIIHRIESHSSKGKTLQ